MKKLIIYSLMVLSGCAKPALDITAYQQKMQRAGQVVQSHNLSVQMLTPQQGVYPQLRVFIEGDGRAWITSSRPSTDPTPTQSLMLELLDYELKPAAYLGRPCQFVWAEGCRQSIWTYERFSPPVIAVMNAALDELKVRFQVERFELVGYSGGAAVALLLAQRRNDVVQVQTLAGNVAPKAWTSLKKLSPLTGSLDPTDRVSVLRDIPQRHWIGSHDQVVPMEVLLAYKAKVMPVCVETITVAADHWQGYQESWLRGKDKPISCP